MPAWLIPPLKTRAPLVNALAKVAVDPSVIAVFMVCVEADALVIKGLLVVLAGLLLCKARVMPFPLIVKALALAVKMIALLVKLDRSLLRLVAVLFVKSKRALVPLTGALTQFPAVLKLVPLAVVDHWLVTTCALAEGEARNPAARAVIKAAARRLRVARITKSKDARGAAVCMLSGGIEVGICMRLPPTLTDTMFFERFLERRRLRGEEKQIAWIERG